MNESRIIKSIHFYIVECFINGTYWHIDNLIAASSTIIYPFLDNISYEDKDFESKFGSVRDLCTQLKEFRKHNPHIKKTSMNLSFKGFSEFFLVEFSQKLSLSTKTEYAKKIASFIESVGSDGYISLKDNEKFYRSILNIYEKDSHLFEYGTEPYIPPTIEEENKQIPDKPNGGGTIGIPSKEKNNRIHGSNSKKETEDEKALNKFWQDKIYGDDYKECMPYVWKLRISHATYRELKEKLKPVCLYLKLSTLYDRHSEKLFVYVAEWFKWEYSPGGQNKVFDDLQLSNISSKIWNSLNKWSNFKYSGNSNEIHLYSIYALGGLPLLAIKNSKKIDNLFECLLNNNDDIDSVISSLENVLSGNSDAFRQSLTDSIHGSWCKFIQAMSESPESLYADIDKDENELVKFFYERLENGRRQSVEKSIKCNWIFYTSPDSEEIAGDIIVNIGRDNSKGCVSTEVVKSEDEQLYIGIECKNEIINYRKYSKTIDGKRFAGWGTTSNRIRGYVEDLCQPITLCKYKTSLLEVTKGELIAPPFKLGNKYIEVYATDDRSGWTTLREFKKNSKAVLFPSNIYEIVGNTSPIQHKVIGEEQWFLCEILDAVQLINKETGKTHNLYQEDKVSLRITPKTDTIRYYDSSKSLVKCCINGQEEYLPLMMGVPSGRCVFIHPNNANEQIKQIRFKDISKDTDIEYTQDYSRNNFLGTSPRPGIITLDIKRYDFKKKYVYLPQNAIKRDLSSRCIIFENEVKKIERVSSDGDVELLDSNVYKDINISQLELTDIIEDTLLFRVYISEKDYVELEVYRPISCRELSKDGQIIERYSDAKQEIKLPYILKDEFTLKVIDENGVRTISSIKNQSWFSLGKPQNAKFLSSAFQNNDDSLNIYLYTNCQVTDEKIGVLKIGSKGVDQYKFYYWKVDEITPPSIIRTSYDKENQCLVIPTECLTNGGLIFQSLNNCSPMHYVAPIYANSNWRLLINPVYANSLIFKCFEIANTHKVPFTQFYPLHRAATNLTTLRALYDNVISNKRLNNSIGYAELHRFANEFCFEWILMPQSFWKGADKGLVVKFLQHSKFIQNSADKQLFGHLVELYLGRKLQNTQVRKGNISKVFKYMRGLRNKDISIIPTSNNNVEVIKNLYESNEWIADLLAIFEK